MSIFSECLKNIRDSHDISTTNLARLIGQDVTTVHRWCNGSRTPSYFEPIALLGERMELSVMERQELEDSYMETIYGREKYIHYLNVKNMILYLNEECKSITHSHMLPRPPVDNTAASQTIKPYFISLDNHRQIISEVNRLIQNASFEDTIYLKLSEPISEIFNIIFYNMITFGFHKMKIIFCMSDHDLFNDTNGQEIFKNLCDMFLYNADCNIYLTTKKTLSIEYHKNCIFTKKQAIHFNSDMQKGISTNYDQWIWDLMVDYQNLKNKSRLIGHKNTLVVDQKKYFSDNDRLATYEYMPCITLALDRKCMEDHIYPNIPDREEFIDTILKNYTMEGVGMMDLDVISCEKGMRTFMETGKLTIFPYPVYDPFPMEERKMLMRRIISYNKSNDCSLNLRFQKNMDIGHVPCFEFQLNEYAENVEKSNMNLIIVLEDFTSHKIFFHSPAIIQRCKDFMEVVSNPYYCYSQEQTIEIMERVLEEY